MCIWMDENRKQWFSYIQEGWHPKVNLSHRQLTEKLVSKALYFAWAACFLTAGLDMSSATSWVCRTVKSNTLVLGTRH